MMTAEEKRAYMRAYRAEHREQINATARRWKANNPDKVKGYQRKYLERHRDEIRARNRQWRLDHPEEAHRRYHEQYLRRKKQDLHKSIKKEETP